MSGLRWMLAGAVGAGALGLSTLWLAATGDVIAAVAAVAVGSGGFGAAARRRQLARLPLAVAPHAAVGSRLSGSSVAVRVWLGRGRRVEAVVARAQWDGQPVEVSVVPGPVVGPFLVVVDGDATSGTLAVELEATTADQTWSTRAEFGPEALRAGRFAPPVDVSAGRVSWRRAQWAEIEAPL